MENTAVHLACDTRLTQNLIAMAVALACVPYPWHVCSRIELVAEHLQAQPNGLVLQAA
jgi:hypothetical protein